VRLTSGLTVGTSNIMPVNVTIDACHLIVQNGTGVDMEPGSAMPTINHGNNALFGNTANYYGMAVDGPGYVKSDPLLDTTVTPPRLGQGSPARGAADPGHAPAKDFWGRTRGQSPDIGAVQN
jgi:hypothetical protein